MVIKSISVFSKKLIIIFSSIFFFTQSAFATSIKLHPKFGATIDSLENLQYNLFGDIHGFTAARVYKNHPNRYDLHIIRNLPDRAQILIITIPITTFNNLQNKIKDRVKKGTTSITTFSPALYPIQDSQWQEKSVHKKLITQYDRTLYVTLLKAMSDTLIVETRDDLQIAVPDCIIKDISSVDLYDEAANHRDPGSSQLFIAPTGRTLEAGNGVFKDYAFILPTLSVGVTSHISVSGGVSLWQNLESQLVYITPKIAWQKEKIGFALGSMNLALPDNDGNLHLGYAVTTYGRDEAAITAGLALPLFPHDDMKYAAILGAELQLSDHVKFITENWLISDNEKKTFTSGGIRIFNKHISFDIALIFSSEKYTGGYHFIPLADFSIFFGQ